MSEQTAEPFKYIAGNPALDFANTAERWDGDVPSGEQLNGYDDLVRWSEGARLVDRPMARRLLADAARRPREAARALARGLELRRLVYRLFAGLAEGHRPAPADLGALNAALAAALPHQLLVRVGGEFIWSWDDAPALDRPLWPVLRAASELLTSDRLPRVRVCGGERCHWLFLDETKNRSRRWCDMAVCGNRAKARRHYDRSRGDDRPSARKAARA
jgi:predicted RNA-binding Zn ribbon-like protein